MGNPQTLANITDQTILYKFERENKGRNKRQYSEARRKEWNSNSFDEKVFTHLP